ncbi:uncharacterized protein Tco025E_04500 [Trypanosoma conorhini]|uniref:Uncharacterized protein n=1 Tax=Trypanosoma conorhini TaxID=83891 RepID=A0A3R7PDX8_9TRYP|nr:uncharacterized protein Tco025E_04500 [Trypanosoma conorhini]RNF18498.1 hypothetical protein Tco025E_04500 [Trypanosoma conorhini]
MSAVNGNSEDCVAVPTLPPSRFTEKLPPSATNKEEDDTVATLRKQFRCAELNNCILHDNIDTLKAVANQLAAQLDLANSRLALYEEKEQAQALRQLGRETQGKRSPHFEASAAGAEHEGRVTSLLSIVREKDTLLTALRSELGKQKEDAAALLRTWLDRKDNEILRLTGELEQLRTVQGIGRYAQARRK